ncbi:hypothetical protein [uncultured Arthrobacter sp.]|uniref:hypothetical protein n=1 Tax=uncultured Arthrobacter sp. TaxID=114050 RepID=UPI0028D419B8|nr:hypothetical protein [uncultured Arthrobacter sp.]
MTDGKLAVTGFEAASPAHGRSAVGGVTHLFHRLYGGNPGYYSSRIYCATGFSGAGFKNATGYGETAAHEALDKQATQGLDLVRPERFSSLQPAF